MTQDELRNMLLEERNKFYQQENEVSVRDIRQMFPEFTNDVARDFLNKLAEQGKAYYVGEKTLRGGGARGGVWIIS